MSKVGTWGKKFSTMVQKLVLGVKSSVLWFKSWYLMSKVGCKGYSSLFVRVEKKRLKKKKKKKKKQDLAKARLCQRPCEILFCKSKRGIWG